VEVNERIVQLRLNGTRISLKRNERESITYMFAWRFLEMRMVVLRTRINIMFWTFGLTLALLCLGRPNYKSIYKLVQSHRIIFPVTLVPLLVLCYTMSKVVL